MVSVCELRVSYGPVEILHGVNFTVNRGETLVILGGSGFREKYAPAHVSRPGKTHLGGNLD